MSERKYRCLETFFKKMKAFENRYLQNHQICAPIFRLFPSVVKTSIEVQQKYNQLNLHVVFIQHIIKVDYRKRWFFVFLLYVQVKINIFSRGGTFLLSPWVEPMPNGG